MADHPRGVTYNIYRLTVDAKIKREKYKPTLQFRRFQKCFWHNLEEDSMENDETNWCQ